MAIDGDFDACQALVKQAFDDRALKSAALEFCQLDQHQPPAGANLLLHYFEAVAQLPQDARNHLVISVPSGNFGDLTADLLAKSLSLPVKRFIAATNANDTVPRFLSNGQWQPRSRTPRVRHYLTPWMSANRTTGHGWQSCSAAKSGNGQS